MNPSPPTPALSPLLRVRDLCVRHATADGGTETVSGVAFDVPAGGAVGIVGESGSGKSQTALALIGLHGPSTRVQGSIRFGGDELLALDPAAFRRLRGARIGTVFQDPMSSLNPYRRIGMQLAEVLETHRGATRSAAWAAAARALDAVRVSSPLQRLQQYPHELSGGMRQRVTIAMAIIAGPQLLIADEPTTALDPTVQVQILELLDQLRREQGLALLLITHDLGVVARLCEQTLVMVSGNLVEAGPTRELLSAPRHPYTAALLRARPSIHHPPGMPLNGLPGQPTLAHESGQGCRFAARCERVQPDCIALPLYRQTHDAAEQRVLLCRHPLRPFAPHR